MFLLSAFAGVLLLMSPVIYTDVQNLQEEKHQQALVEYYAPLYCEDDNTNSDLI